MKSQTNQARASWWLEHVTRWRQSAECKNDHRMLRNYLKGRIGDSVNLFMACAAFNFRKFIRMLRFLCLKLLGHVFRPNVRPEQAWA